MRRNWRRRRRRASSWRQGALGSRSFFSTRRTSGGATASRCARSWATPRARPRWKRRGTRSEEAAIRTAPRNRETRGARSSRRRVRAPLLLAARGRPRGDRGAGARRAASRTYRRRRRAARPEGPGDRVGSIPARARRRFPRRPPAGVDPEAFLFFDARVWTGAPRRRCGDRPREFFACRRGRKDDFRPVPVRHETRASRGRRVGTSLRRSTSPRRASTSAPGTEKAVRGARRTAERGATVETAAPPPCWFEPRPSCATSPATALPPTMDAAIATMRVGEEATSTRRRRVRRRSRGVPPAGDDAADARGVAAGAAWSRVRLLGRPTCVTRVRRRRGGQAEAGGGRRPISANARRRARAHMRENTAPGGGGGDPSRRLSVPSRGRRSVRGAGVGESRVRARHGRTMPLAWLARERGPGGGVVRAADGARTRDRAGDRARCAARARGARPCASSVGRAGRRWFTEARGARARARRDAHRHEQKRARLGFRRAPFGFERPVNVGRAVGHAEMARGGGRRGLDRLASVRAGRLEPARSTRRPAGPAGDPRLQTEGRSRRRRNRHRRDPEPDRRVPAPGPHRARSRKRIANAELDRASRACGRGVLPRRRTSTREPARDFSAVAEGDEPLRLRRDAPARKG